MPFEIDRCAMPESDERLLAVYGDDATISRVGLFTLVHLDSPSPETVVQRTSEFDPLEFFFDDCELCRASLDQGGLFVFACDHLDYAGVHAATPARTPAAELLRALDRLDVACDELLCALEPIASANLLRQAIESVGFLHDRVTDIAWDEVPARRLPALERIIAASLTTLAVVRAEYPAIEEIAGNVDASIAGVSNSLRATFEGPI